MALLLVSAVLGHAPSRNEEVDARSGGRTKWWAARKGSLTTSTQGPLRAWASQFLSPGGFMRSAWRAGLFTLINSPPVGEPIKFLSTRSSTYEVAVHVGQGGRAPSRAPFLASGSWRVVAVIALRHAGGRQISSLFKIPLTLEPAPWAWVAQGHSFTFCKAQTWVESFPCKDNFLLGRGSLAPACLSPHYFPLVLSNGKVM